MIRLVLPLALILAGAASPASARNEQNPAVRKVVYQDLDLASASGRAVLDRRIHAAVNAVCGEAEQFDFKGKSRVRHCREDTTANAVTQRDRLLAAQLPQTNLALSR